MVARKIVPCVQLCLQKNSVEMILEEEHPELLADGKCLKLVHRQAQTTLDVLLTLYCWV